MAFYKGNQLISGLDLKTSSSGGIIDGTVLTTFETDNIDIQSTTTSQPLYEIYTTKNDCALYLESNRNYLPLKFYIDSEGTKPIIKTFENYAHEDNGTGHVVFLKKGVKIYAQSFLKQQTSPQNYYKFKFIEYKISSITPEHSVTGGGVIDGTILTTETKDITVPVHTAEPVDFYEVKNDCYLYCSNEPTAIVNLLVHIKDHPEQKIYEGTDQASQDTISFGRPIKKGTKLVCRRFNGGTQATIKFTFIEYKLNSLDQSLDQILNVLYPVGSVYFDGNNGDICPLKVVITDSEWDEIGTKILTGGSTAHVVGNGMTIGFTDGVNNVGLLVPRGSYFGASSNVYGVSVGSSGSNTALDNKSLGLTTDPEKSGLITDLGSATGITVKIWKRIS